MDRRRLMIWLFWATLAVLAVARVLWSLHHEAPYIGGCLGSAVHGLGVVSDEPERKESGQILIVSVFEWFADAVGGSDSGDGIPVATTTCPADVLVRVKTKSYPGFSYGDQVSFTGKVSRPFNFDSNGGRTFDYRGYLAKDDIYYEMKSASVSLAGSGETQGSTDIADSSLSSNPIVSGLYRIKRAFVANLESVLGEPHAALAAGLVVGEKSALGADLLDDFRTVGLIHIVVLSGFNITIVGDAMRRVLSRLPRVWGIVAASVGIISFGIMVGGGATVVRSCIMACLALFANLIRRDYNVVRALALAALVMMIISPDILLHDPSFQLSFLATVGLLLLSAPVAKYLSFLPERFEIRGTVAATLATQIFVSPYILYMMGRLSLIGVVVNILVLPVIPATMLAIALTGGLGFVSSILSQFAGFAAHILLSYELFMVRNFARLPFAAVDVPAFSIWLVAAFYAVFIAAYVSISLLRRSSARSLTS